MKKILITGAGGWLGSELTEQLLLNGHHIRALVLEVTPALKKLKDVYLEQLELVVGDICNELVVRECLINVDIVYHLAAKVHTLANSKNEESQFFKINYEATKTLFELCSDQELERVIFYSSVSVYGDSDELITVDSVPNPQTPYAKSKLLAEEIAKQLFVEKGLPITIVQPVTVYGGADIGNFDKLKRLVNKGFLVRFGHGKNKKSVIYYKDLINMTLKIAKDSSLIGKTIICGTENLSVNEINQLLIDATDKKVLYLKVPHKFTHLIHVIVSKIPISPIKKINRQIIVLSSSNEFDIMPCQSYCSNFVSFNMIYGRGEGI